MDVVEEKDSLNILERICLRRASDVAESKKRASSSEAALRKRVEERKKFSIRTNGLF